MRRWRWEQFRLRLVPERHRLTSTERGSGVTLASRDVVEEGCQQGISVLVSAPGSGEAAPCRTTFHESRYRPCHSRDVLTRGMRLEILATRKAEFGPGGAAKRVRDVSEWAAEVDWMNRAHRYQGEASLSDASDAYGPMSDDRAAGGAPPTVRFVNTYRPVVPLYETVAAAAESYGWRVVACMSRGIYRPIDDAGFANDPAIGTQSIWVPDLLRKSGVASNLFFSILAPFALAGGPQSDLNIFLTHPPLFYVLGGAVSRRRGVPYFIHLMDLYPEILQQAGWLSATSPLYRRLSALSLRALERAAGIIVIGRCMEERLIANGIDPAKIHYMPNSFSTQIRTVEHSQNRFRQRFGLQDKFVVMYSGNMGLLHELKTLLAVADSLADHDRIRFVFVGSGRRRGAVQAAIDRGARNISLIEYQADGDDLAHSLSAADVHFVSLRAGCEGLVVPSKFYGAIAAGRPVIYEGGARGEVARVIRATGCGTVVELGDAVGLRSAISSFYTDHDRCLRIGAIALDVHRTQYQSSALATAYCRAIARSLVAGTAQ